METKTKLLYQEKTHSTQIKHVLADHINKIHTVQIKLMMSIPVMIKSANSKKQIEKLEKHFNETKDQVNRLSQILNLINDNPVSHSKRQNQKNNDAKPDNEDFDAHTLTNNAGYYENNSNRKSNY